MKHEGTALNERREKIAKASAKVKETTTRYMDWVGMHLDAYASQRWFRAGGGTGSAPWEEVFPHVEPPSPQPFPQTAKGETVIHPEDIEPGSEAKYFERPGPDVTTESMVEVVERSLKAFAGPEWLKDLVLTVHPQCGRFSPTDYPDCPFMAYSDKVMGPNVGFRTKEHFAKTCEVVYNQFRHTVRREAKNQDFRPTDSEREPSGGV